MTFSSSSSSEEDHHSKQKKSTAALCRLCHNDSDVINGFDLQLLSSSKTIRAHYFCLLFSSGLGQFGKTESEGLRGFLEADVRRELKRGSRLKCSYCKKPGATVGCSRPQCKRSYHLPCGMKNGSLQQHFDQYKSFCSVHRPQQRRKINVKLREKFSCSICQSRSFSEDASPSAKSSCVSETLWSPCCDRWLHRSCVQVRAQTVGALQFRCPDCGDESRFVSEMKTFGIYLPNLKRMNKSCDAKMCFCDQPEWRNHNDYEDGEWKILTCFICELRGIHQKCGGLDEYVEPAWHCYECRKNKNTDKRIQKLEDRPIKAVWGSARAKKEKRSDEEKQKRKIDPMSLSLEDIIVKGLDSESTWNEPSSSALATIQHIRTSEGAGSPGDSDYESESSNSSKNTQQPTIPFKIRKKEVFESGKNKRTTNYNATIENAA